MENLVSLILSDWERYLSLHKNPNFFLKVFVIFHNPGAFFSVCYRFERNLLYQGNKLEKLIGIFLYPIYFLYTYFVLDIDIPPSVKIGRSLYIHNRGITFSQTVVAGSNLTLIGPITIGMKGTPSGGNLTPKIGNDVYVFAGARIVGGVKIGNNVYVGANAVVTHDIPPNVAVGGVPAKIIKRLNKLKH